MSKVTGRVEIVCNGDLLLNKSGAKIGGVGISGELALERKEVMGDTGIHGFVEEPVVAFCDVTITDRDDVSLDAIARINQDGTIIFRSAGGGKVYTMNGATSTRNFEVTAGEGETPIRFVGDKWIEGTQ